MIATAVVAVAVLIPAGVAAESKGNTRVDAVAIARSNVDVKRTLTWQCEKRLGKTRTRTEQLERRTRSLAVIGWVDRTWEKRLAVCLKRERHRTLPHPNDWRTSVRVVQRAYPDTHGWLMSCSSSEGGHGRWVANRQGSGASGWLQFMHSTFTRMFNAAHADVTARGFIVPGEAGSWYSPLGQALAGAWGYTHGRRHEWAGSGC